MELKEAKEQFIHAWGTLGSNWGINKTMAQVHALLLVSPDPLSAEEIMAELNISRGNANMNLRDLIEWGIVNKIHKSGERKEFFSAEKDIWEVAKQIAKERKKRELEPVMKVLNQLQNVEGDVNEKDHKAFTETISNIQKFANNADSTIDKLIKADENWFLSSFMKLIR
ncbi:MAG TPA: transcriptional regulator [Cytophagales bacterium]|nr:transcriptional regulator [Cytophagales bacterium]